MENRAFGALAAALLLCCVFTSAAATEPLRVLYAEPFQAQTLRTPGAQKTGPSDLRVQAFGRTFELQLEDNSRLLRAASAATRARFGAIQLLKGTIKDAPGSWVRLTLKEGRYSGAFWDGSELYAIAPRETLDEALAVPLAAVPSAIYRLSDTQGGLFDGTCATGGRPSSAGPTAKFRSLIRELRATADSAFAAAPREIQVAMVGDFAFTNRFGSLAAQAMLDRMNVVDGIFSSQVGVATLPTDFITFSVTTDPFDSNEPSTLLEQFGTYRNATPAIRSRGLAHLLTGRQLAGDIVGIAYLGSICTARFGAGLSEVSSFIDSPLVMAHEIGHNFGAPHDAETGSPCAGTPAAFLMAPELNFSSTFSACSLEQMQQRVDAASCIVTARNRDLAVSAPAELNPVIDQPFDYVIDVTSVGEVAAVNGKVTAELSSTLQVLSATMPGATCTTFFARVECTLGDLPPGESRRLTVRLQGEGRLGDVLRATVTSSSDSNPANDSVETLVQSVDARIVQVLVSPQPITATVAEPFDLFYDVAAAGVEPLSGVRAVINSDQLRPLGASVSGGSCTIDAPTRRVTCDIGNIALGTPRQVRVQWIADFMGDLDGVATAFEIANQNVAGGQRFNVHVQPARDVGISSAEPFQRVPVGVDGTFSFLVASSGRDAVDDVHVQLSTFGGVTLMVDGPIAASCTSAGDVTNCALGSLAPQATRTLQIRAHADAVMNTQIRARILLSTPDDFSGNDFTAVGLDVRFGNDVEISGSYPADAVEGQPAVLSAQLASLGANAAENVRLQMTFPTGYVVRSATLSGEPCTIDPANPHLATCAAAQLAPVSFAPVEVNFIAPAAGAGTLLFAATCDNDANPANDNLTLSLQVLPEIDAALTAAPPPERARTDLPIDLLFTIHTNRYSLPDATLVFAWFSSLDDFSASAPGAICGPIAGGYRCDWTAVPANTSIPVSVRAHGSVRSDVSLSAFLGSSARDVNFNNNSEFLTFPILVPGDAAVSVSQPTVTATAGELFVMPGIDVVVLSPVEQHYVDLGIPAGHLEAATLSDGFCTQAPTVLRCVIFGVQQPGTYHLNLQGVPQHVAELTIPIRVVAFNDFNTENDQQMLTLNIVERTTPPPPPPPPPPPSGGGGGGGGGGSMSWLLAALLLMMWHHRQARSRVYR